MIMFFYKASVPLFAEMKDIVLMMPQNIFNAYETHTDKNVCLIINSA